MSTRFNPYFFLTYRPAISMLFQCGYVARRMHLRDPFVFRLARRDLRQLSRGTTLFEPLHDGAEPIRRLGMPRTHVVLKIGRMIDKTGFPHSKPRENVMCEPCS